MCKTCGHAFSTAQTTKVVWVTKLYMKIFIGGRIRWCYNDEDAYRRRWSSFECIDCHKRQHLNDGVVLNTQYFCQYNSDH